MITKDFVDKIKDIGYDLIHDSHETLILGSAHEVVVKISEIDRGAVRFNATIDKEAEDTVMDYANTPISKRKEQKKYYVRLKGIDEADAYLNFNQSNGQYFVDDKDGVSDINTKFVKTEIKSLVDDPDFFLQSDSYKLEPANQ